MNTLKQVIRLAAVVLLTLARIVKEILQLLPKLVSQVSAYIHKKLRFSITFKTTLVYALMFFNLLLFFIVAAAGGFGFYLWQSALQSTERSSRYISQLLSGGSQDMNDRIKAYAENEGIAVRCLMKKSSQYLQQPEQTQHCTCCLRRLPGPE